MKREREKKKQSEILRHWVAPFPLVSSTKTCIPFFPWCFRKHAKHAVRTFLSVLHVHALKTRRKKGLWGDNASSSRPMIAKKNSWRLSPIERHAEMNDKQKCLSQDRVSVCCIGRSTEVEVVLRNVDKAREGRAEKWCAGQAQDWMMKQKPLMPRWNRQMGYIMRKRTPENQLSERRWKRNEQVCVVCVARNDRLLCCFAADRVVWWWL
jgi:hypothetical protein